MTARAVRQAGGTWQRLAAGLGARWNGFWYAEGSTLSLSVFRILFALALLNELGVSREKSIFGLADGRFHLPYLPFIPLVPESRFYALHGLQWVLIGLLALGLFRRTTCAALLVLQGWVFFADQLNFRNHPYFFLLVLLALLLAPSTDALSLGSMLRARGRGQSSRNALLGSSQALTYQRLIQVQVGIVYFYAALHKLSPQFLDGNVLSYYLTKSVPRQARDWLGLAPETVSRLRDLVADPSNLVVLSVATVALELVLPFALFHRRLRPWAMALGIPFHIGIALTMGIWAFSWVMIGSYILFLEPETLPGLARRMTRPPPSPPGG